MQQMVSILIPVYNRKSLISETLDSALNQTYSNIEVVIVDNASNDGTWELLQKYAQKDQRIKLFRNESNIGPVKNWMRCIEEATGFYGKILWSDDLIEPTYLEKTLPLFFEDVGFVYTGVNIFKEDPLKGKKRYFLGKTGLYPVDTYIQKVLYDKNAPFSPGCAIFRLNDLRSGLLIDVPNSIKSDFSMHAIGNDLLIFLLTTVKYKSFGFVSESLSFFRAHDGSISSSSESGKLPLHYALAKAYFVEKYLPERRNCFASFVCLLLWEYRNSKTFGMNCLNDFFRSSCTPSKLCLFKGVCLMVINSPKKFLKKIVGS